MFEINDVKLSIISLPLNTLFSTIASTFFSFASLLITIEVGFAIPSTFLFNKGTIPFNATFIVLPSTLNENSTDF